VGFIFDGGGGEKIRKVCSGDPGKDFIRPCIPETAEDLQVRAPLECDVGDQGLGLYNAAAGYRQVLKLIPDRGSTLGDVERRLHERNPQGDPLE